MSAEEGACLDLGNGIGNMSVKFHQNHCQGLVLCPERTTASWRTRLQGNHKIAFSERPILRNEKVYVRVMENSIVYENGPETQRKATFGFVSFNPAKLTTVAGQIELQDSMDMRSCLVTENLKKGSTYSFWLDNEGKLNRGGDVNNKTAQIRNDPDVTTDIPMWFMVKAKGNVTLKFVESEVLYMIAGENGSGNVPITYIYPDLANAFAHIMQANNNKRVEEMGNDAKKLKQIEGEPIMSINEDSYNNNNVKDTAVAVSIESGSECHEVSWER